MNFIPHPTVLSVMSAKTNAIRKGHILLTQKNNLKGNLFFPNTAQILNSRTKIGIASVKISYDKTSLINPHDIPVSVGCNSITDQNNQHHLRNFIISPRAHKDYQEFIFDEIYFHSINKTYQDIVFFCSEPGIILEHLFIIFQEDA